MALPYELDSVPIWNAENLAGLPAAEDEWHEFKSSRIALADLRKEIAIAASGFWNTGGGMIVAGVDATGRPDGGIPTSVGRTPIRDWVDNCLSEVAPRSEYRVAVLTDETEGVTSDHGVLIVAFGESHTAPHMAHDRRYYIRAGAHTAPAPHFVVEALMARRGLAQPVLRPMLRHKPGVGYVIQLGIVAASPTPALDVDLTLANPPRYLPNSGKPFSISIGVISSEAPFFDFHVMHFGEEDSDPITVHLRYRDIAGRPYETEFSVDLERQLGVTLIGEPGTRKLEDRLEKIESAIKSLGSHAKNNEQHLRTIAKKSDKLAV